MSWILSSTSSRLRWVSMRVRSTPDMISLMTFCLGVAFGLSCRFLRWGMSRSFTKS